MVARAVLARRPALGLGLVNRMPNKRVVLISLASVMPFLAIGLWGVMQPPGPGYRIVNDTGRTVRIAACSQDRPDFPGAFDIPAGRSVRMRDDWLPSDDPGAACFLYSRATGGKVAFQGCLKMPTDPGSRDSFMVSEADRSLGQRQCMALSNPGPP